VHRFVVFLAFGLFAAGVGEPAFAKRVALVVGNDAYTNLPVLRKSANDAAAVAATLEEMGFQVLLGSNLTRRETNRKLADFEAEIAPGDQAFFFFAGHGVALGAENYIMPTDMPKPGAGEESLVQDEAHAVSALIVRVQARGAAATFFVLDACRDNPFAATGVRSIGTSRGLTRVEAPTGVFVLFSAGIGQAALDRLSDADDDPNSVFTRKLVPLLKTPGLSHVAIAKRLQEEVSALAGTVRHSQQPAYYDQIVGEVVLRPIAALNPEAPVPPSEESSASEAARTWQIIEGTSSPAVLKAFIGKFPESIFADFAKARLSELADSLSPEPGSEAGSTEEPEQAAVEPETEAASDDRAVVQSIQTALNRHGCNSGATDGLWGAKSSRAVAAFARQTGLALDPLPSESLLAALNARQDRACQGVPEETEQPPTPPKEVKAAVQPLPEPPAEPNPPPRSTQAFRNPTVGGLVLDGCYSWPGDCASKRQADAFCAEEGHDEASDWETENRVGAFTTKRLGDSGTCFASCTVMTYVECE